MAVHRYGAEKYGSGGLLASSAGRGWSCLSAELRSHSDGVVARKSTQPDTEISVDMRSYRPRPRPVGCLPKHWLPVSPQD